MGVAMQVDVSVGGLHVSHVLHHRIHRFSCEGPFRGELWEAVWQPGGPHLWHLQLPGHYHVCLWRPGDHARDTGEAIQSWKDRNEKSVTVGDHSGSRCDQWQHTTYHVAARFGQDCDTVCVYKSILRGCASSPSGGKWALMHVYIMTV